MDIVTFLPLFLASCVAFLSAHFLDLGVKALIKQDSTKASYYLRGMLYSLLGAILFIVLYVGVLIEY